MKGKAAIVLIACGFSREPQSTNDYEALSTVDADRRDYVKRALERYRDSEYVCEIWTTGQVAWTPREEAEGKTLASLNATAILDAWWRGEARECEFRQVPGRNAFSESWNACEMARAHDIGTLVIVTSTFYLVAYRGMWEAAARRAGVKIVFHGAYHYQDTVSEQVRAFYRSFQPRVLASVAASCAYGHRVAMALADWKTRSRETRGFKIDGCTRIA